MVHCKQVVLPCANAVPGGSFKGVETLSPAPPAMERGFLFYASGVNEVFDCFRGIPDKPSVENDGREQTAPSEALDAMRTKIQPLRHLPASPKASGGGLIGLGSLAVARRL